MAIPGLQGMSPKAVAIQAYKQFMRDDMSTYAAALSYSVLFALAPFTLFLLSLLGALGLPEFFDWLLEQARASLPSTAYEPVETIITQVQSGSGGGLLSFGIIAALWGASGGVRSLMNALNVAYNVEETRPLLKRYPMSVAYTLALAVLLIVAVGLMLFGPQAVEWIADQAGLGSLFVTLWAWLRIPVAIVLLMLAIAAVYYALPNVDQQFRLITVGSVLAVVVWVIATIGFSIYVSNFGNYNATYGSIGGVIALLFYFYISSAIVLLGAEVNQIVYRAKEGEPEPQG